MKTRDLQIHTFRRKHGLSDSAARIVATLYYGEGR